ncbi:MAG: 5'-3' exonuclease H3TH domain-containing protein [Actinomycetales bacterium]
MPHTLMLLDSASMYFRAYFGVPKEFLTADGRPVNAVRGFLDMVAVLVQDHRPNALVACWDDDWRPAWRVDLMPSYKTHRVAENSAPAEPGAGVAEEEVEDELAVQVPMIAEILQAFGIARVGAPGCEADDVIGTLATRAAAQGRRVDIVTGDRDLFQLVDDEHGVRVLFVAARSGLRNRVSVDQAELTRRYQVASGPAYADLATMRGDSSDGIPGVPGIGEKTGAALLASFGDLPGIQRAAADPASAMTPAVRRKVLAAAEYLQVAPTVVRVLRDAELPAIDDELPRTPADPQRLDELGAAYGVASSIERLRAALAAQASHDG